MYNVFFCVCVSPEMQPLHKSPSFPKNPVRKVEQQSKGNAVYSVELQQCLMLRQRFSLGEA